MVTSHLSTVCIIALLIVCIPASAAPDRRGDPAYMDTQIKHISDADLFAAIDLERPGLERVKAAVAAADYASAYAAWADYWDAKDKLTLVQQGEGLQPLEEAIAQGRGDADAIAAAVAAAEPLMRHEITGWGDVTHQHGDVIDFNHFYGTSGQYGFHYWYWSVPLFSAWYATGDEKYLEKFDLFFNQWYEQRDAVQGRIKDLDVIYYELGLGLRNRWFMQYYSFPYTNRSVQTHERMLKTALGAARWLYELQARGYRGGNWQIMGSYGLTDIGVRLQEFKEAPEWIETGVARLAEHLERDFFADGCHSERVPTSYMTIAYRDPRDVMVLLQAGGIESEITRQFGARLEKTLEWWMLAATPLGGLPALNDGSSRALPHAWLLEGAEVYNRSDFRYVAEHLGMRQETAAEPPALTSVNLEPSGVAVMRGGWERDDAYMFLDYGTTNAGHTHRATHHFELYGNGAPLALDAGIGLTYDDPLHGPWYTQARAHNMLTVDDANIDKSTARGRDITWHSDDHLDLFSSTHDGYKASHGVIHTRTVAFLKPDVFIVRDTCTAEREGQRLSWYFHSPTDLSVVRDGQVRSADGPGVLLVDAEPVTLSGIREGQGRCSLSQLGGYRDIDWISFDRTSLAGSDNEFAIAMLPFAEDAPDVQFRRLGADRPGVAAYRLWRPTCTDLIVFGDGAPVTIAGTLTTDGAFAWARKLQGGQWRGVIIGGTSLRVDGVEVGAFSQ